jgi:glycosyltransferase 2 family protein
VSVLAIVVLLRLARWEDLLPALSNLSWQTLLPAILLFVISMLGRALTWWILLRRKAPYPRTVLILNEGYLLNNLFPFRLGELGRSVLMGEASGTGPFYVLPTIILERSFDLLIAAGLLLASLPFVFGATWAQPLAVGTLIVILGAFVLLFAGAKKRSTWRPWLDRLLSRWPLFSRTVLPWFDALLDGFEIIAHPAQFLLAFGCMLVSWVLALGEYTVLLTSFAPQAQLWWPAFILGVAAFGVALPSAPGAIGVFEASVVGSMALLGVSAAHALAYALVIHLIHFLITGAIGLFGLYREGDTLLGIYRRIVQSRSRKPAETLG